MKPKMTPKWMAVLGICLLASQAGAGEPQPPATQKERESYTIGVDTARVLRQQGMEVDLDTLIQGLRDGMSGEKLLMTDPDLLATRNAIQKALARKLAEKKKNRGKGQAPKKPGEENR